MIAAGRMAPFRPDVDCGLLRENYYSRQTFYAGNPEALPVCYLCSFVFICGSRFQISRPNGRPRGGMSGLRRGGCIGSGHAALQLGGVAWPAAWSDLRSRAAA